MFKVCKKFCILNYCKKEVIINYGDEWRCVLLMLFLVY